MGGDEAARQRPQALRARSLCPRYSARQTRIATDSAIRACQADAARAGRGKLEERRDRGPALGTLGRRRQILQGSHTAHRAGAPRARARPSDTAGFGSARMLPRGRQPPRGMIVAERQRVLPCPAPRLTPDDALATEFFLVDEKMIGPARPGIQAPGPVFNQEPELIELPPPPAPPPL